MERKKQENSRKSSISINERPNLKIKGGRCSVLNSKENQERKMKSIDDYIKKQCCARATREKSKKREEKLPGSGKKKIKIIYKRKYMD